MHLYKTLISICGLYILLCFIVICLLISVVLLCLLFRSAAFSQLPGCFLFIGNIYAGSRALSLLVSTKCILKHELQCLSNVGNEHATFVCAYVEICLSLLFFQPIPFFFVFQNVSEVFAFLIRTAAHREVRLISAAIFWEQTKIYFLHVSFPFLYVFSRIRNHKTAHFHSILILFHIS